MSLASRRVPLYAAQHLPSCFQGPWSPSPSGGEVPWFVHTVESRRRGHIRAKVLRSRDSAWLPLRFPLGEATRPTACVWFRRDSECLVESEQCVAARRETVPSKAGHTVQTTRRPIGAKREIQ